ncbi:MAG: hypothetical protein Q7S92_04865 [Candidatus Diapherotrites archaeon]|nr:hypothetical protein [Candidatus Diapherotrites archaeon]
MLKPPRRPGFLERFLPKRKPAGKPIEPAYKPGTGTTTMRAAGIGIGTRTLGNIIDSAEIHIRQRKVGKAMRLMGSLGEPDLIEERLKDHHLQTIFPHAKPEGLNIMRGCFTAVAAIGLKEWFPENEAAAATKLEKIRRLQDTAGTIAGTLYRKVRARQATTNEIYGTAIMYATLARAFPEIKSYEQTALTINRELIKIAGMEEGRAISIILRADNLADAVDEALQRFHGE